MKDYSATKLMQNFQTKVFDEHFLQIV